MIENKISKYLIEKSEGAEQGEEELRDNFLDIFRSLNDLMQTIKEWKSLGYMDSASHDRARRDIAQAEKLMKSLEQRIEIS